MDKMKLSFLQVLSIETSACALSYEAVILSGGGVLLLGVSKSGFGAGFGSLAVPMMA